MLTLDAPLALSDEAQDLLFRDARTANAFTDGPVTDDQVRAIYDLVRWGPTAMNGQPLRVLLVRSDDARARLLAHVSGGNVAKTASAPLVAVLAYDSRFHERLPETFPHAPAARSWFEQTPEKEAAREASARENAWLQAGYFLLGVRAAGLAAGAMGGFDRAGVDGEFFPDGRWRSFLLVNIGQPAEGAWRERLPRLDYDDVVQTA